MMSLAIVTNTPVDRCWKFTLGQVCRYCASIPAVLPLINPMAGGGEDKQEVMTDPNQIRAFAHSVGLKRG